MDDEASRGYKICTRTTGFYKDITPKVIKSIRLECSKYGEAQVKVKGERIRNKMSKKCGCKWSLNILCDGVKISFKSSNNTHTCLPEEEPVVAKHRKKEVFAAAPCSAPSTFEEKVLFLYNEAKMGVAAIVRQTTVEYPSLTITYEMVNNYIKRFRRINPEKDSIQALIDFLKVSEENDGWTYALQHKENYLTAIAWMSADMSAQMENFGDVAVIDSTYNTNIFRMPLVLVVVHDNEGT
jgi:hypothetical protein